MTECTQEKSGYLHSINSDKHMPQSLFTGQFLLVTKFCIAFYECYLSTLIKKKIKFSLFIRKFRVEQL